jgi:outer membrane protein assembly factor BamB
VDHPPADPNDPNSLVTDNVLALDAASGQILWQTPVGPVASSQLAVGGGRVYATAMSGTAYALDAATGELAWKFDFGDDAPSPPLLAGKTLYFGDGQGRFYARNAQTGDEIWTVVFDQGVAARPAVGGGRVYVGSNDGYLHALDEASGAELWRIRSPERFPFASNPYFPPMDTQPILDAQTLYFFNVEELFALQVP